MSLISDAGQKIMQTAIDLAPARWLPGGTPDPLAAKHGLIGAPVSRVDGPLKVQGKARFAAEVRPANMLYAALFYSAVPRGRITRLDTGAAEASPGVALVMTHENSPRMKAPAMFGTSPDAAGPSDLPVLQDDRVHWNGQPIAVVLAETQEQADYAATLIEAVYGSEPAITRFDTARSNAREPDNVLGEPATVEVGDADAALAAAPVSVDLTYRTPRYNHNAIELHAATCLWESDELTIHDASQLVTATAGTIADMFDMPKDKVRVISPYVGGGFGGKCLWWHQILGAAASKLAGRPVRITLSREGVYRMVGGRTETEQRVALGAGADGRLTALIHAGVAGMTTHNNCPEQFTFPARHMYAAPNLKVVQQVADMDMLANTFMRAPGESVGTFALESAIDELAESLGMDPIELRILNEPERHPTAGTPFSIRNLVEAYRTGAERFGWQAGDRRPASRREGEWQIGTGVATATYPYHRMPGGAVRIRLTREGRAELFVAAHEMGMGTATAQTQVAAERLGLPLDGVSFHYGDSALPGNVLAGGSQQTAAIGAAVAVGHRALVAELLRLAGNDSPLAGLSAEEVGGIDEGLGSLIDPGRHETYRSILERAGRDELVVDGVAPPPLETMHWSMHSYGAMFCEARVNAVTGETRISRFLGSFDCGRILNSKTAASQFRGGIIMGLGMALMEETEFDPRNGRVMNPSLAEYHVPVHLDVPEIEVIWTDIPDPHSPMGAHGIGEIGITGVAAAVANAIYNATGKRVRDLPITLDKLM